MNGLNQKASEFPDSPGVYRFFKNKKILYIGKAKSLKKRVKTYFGKSLKEFKTQKLVNQITGMDFIETNNGDIRIKTSDSSGNLTFTSGGSTERARIDSDGKLLLGHTSSQLVYANACLLYTSPSPRDKRQSRMPSSA